MNAQIQRLIATGFSLADIRSFPDCMRLIEGAADCPETKALHRERLQSILKQIADPEGRRSVFRRRSTKVARLPRISARERSVAASGHLKRTTSPDSADRLTDAVISSVLAPSKPSQSGSSSLRMTAPKWRICST